VSARRLLVTQTAPRGSLGEPGKGQPEHRRRGRAADAPPRHRGGGSTRCWAICSSRRGRPYHDRLGREHLGPHLHSARRRHGRKEKGGSVMFR
jgi:hypothetical protein